MALLLQRFTVLTLHRPTNVDDPPKLCRTLAAVAAVRSDVPIIFPVHPRTRQRLQQLEPAVAGAETPRLIQPAACLDFVHPMAHAPRLPPRSRRVPEEATPLRLPRPPPRPRTRRPAP